MLLDSDRNCNDMSCEFSFEKYSIIYCEHFNLWGKLSLNCGDFLLIYGDVISWIDAAVFSFSKKDNSF